MSTKGIKCSSSMNNRDKHGGVQESDIPSDCTEDVEVTIDSSILDCPICFEPLQLPLFQCINGHVTCSECNTKLMNKCPICSTSTTSGCIPFVSIIGSNKSKCPYTKFGCANYSLPHNRIAAHKNTCRYAPCTCPIPECNFKCEGIMLPSHIVAEHSCFEQRKVFDCGQWFSVLVQKEQPYILQWTGFVYVLLCRRVELGYALWIVDVGSDVQNTYLQDYELEVESLNGNSLKLKGVIRSVRNLDMEASPEFFLYVQPNLFTSTGHLNVKIKICTLGYRIESVFLGRHMFG